MDYGIDTYGSNSGIRPYFVYLGICGSVVQEPTLILLFWGRSGNIGGCRAEIAKLPKAQFG